MLLTSSWTSPSAPTRYRRPEVERPVEIRGHQGISWSSSTQRPAQTLPSACCLAVTAFTTLPVA